MNAEPRARGLLLAMEGIDGAGKTTQVGMLARRLAAAQIPYITTKEPTDGKWGARIRESARTGRMTLHEELTSFLNDRREHVENVLSPALERGDIVLVDRYYISTVAYQGARGMEPRKLIELNSFAPPPDILIILDIEPKLGLQRVRARGDVADLFEREEELEKARKIFVELKLPNLHVIDGTLPQDQVHEYIWSVLESKLRSQSAEPRRVQFGH